MSAVSEILFSPLGVWLRLAAMLLLMLQLCLLLQVISQKRAAAVRLSYLLHALFGGALLTLLLDAAYRLEYLSYQRAYFPAARWIAALPWAAVAAAEAVSLLLCAFCARSILLCAKQRPSAQSVKQTVDLLPAGICVAEEDGLILLSNLKMNACNLALTGSAYSGADALWQTALERGEAHDGKRLVRLPDGTALLLERHELRQDEQRLYQILAEDVTEQYRLTAELSENNARLSELQRRLKDYRQRQTELVIRQELLSARTTIHNQLGGALLTGVYHLEHPESADPETLRLLLQHINTFLLSEAEQPEGEEDSLDTALHTAAGFGVAVGLSGPLPEAGALRALLGQSIAECAANAVKHAGGSRLEVTLEENGFSVTNDGAPPEGEIAPTGGLRSLQLAAEQTGAALTLESSPAFRLTVRLEKPPYGN